MLTKEQIKFYSDNGYLLVEGLFSKKEAADYRRECHDLAARLGKTSNLDATWGSARSTVLVQMRDPQDPPTQKVHLWLGQGMMLRDIDPTAVYRGL